MLTPIFTRQRRKDAASGIFALCIIIASPASWAGAYIFAGESNGIDIITHPSGYTGSGTILNVGVCIDAGSQDAALLEIPVQNVITVWNNLQPVHGNVELGALPNNQVDAESVILHEVGHCIGLAHVNLASESGLSGSAQNYTKSTNGGNNTYDIDPGSDGIIGTDDDIRGDDVNLHWFNPFNDPFMLPIPVPVDDTLYSRDTNGFAPNTWVVNADRAVSTALNYPLSESVMQQGSFFGETQRELVSDDVSSILLAASGMDEIAGTDDDYQLILNYQGIVTDSGTDPGCDITVSIDSSSFAYCSTGGSWISSSDPENDYPHVRITSAEIHLGTGYNWYFNDQLIGGGNLPPVAADDTGSVDEDGLVVIDVLANDSDPEGMALNVAGLSTPPNGSANINPDNTISYTPDSDFNGADSFNYTLSDGSGGSDTATVSVTVNPVNDAPVFDQNPIDNDMAHTGQMYSGNLAASDMDGDALTFEKVSGPDWLSVATVGALSGTPGAEHEGQNLFQVSVSDGKSAPVQADLSIEVISFVDHVADSQSNTWGTVSGAIGDTYAEDQSIQTISEEITNGNPNNRTSRLRHSWDFNVDAGAVTTLHIVGDAGSSSEGDSFKLSYTSAAGNGVLAEALSGPVDASYPLPDALSGQVTVQIEDNDRSGRNTAVDSMSVDHLFIRTAFDSATPPPPASSAPDAPTGLAANGISTSAIQLNWNDASSNEDSFEVERSEDGGSNFTLTAQLGADTTEYTDDGLSAAKTYHYRVRASNAAGNSSYTSTASAATLSGGAATSMHIGALSGSANDNGRRWNATLTVTVLDDNNSPVSAATVSGNWNKSGGNCTTNDNGACSISKDFKDSVASAVFTVNSVTHATLSYDADANVVSTVTISQP